MGFIVGNVEPGPYASLSSKKLLRGALRRILASRTSEPLSSAGGLHAFVAPRTLGVRSNHVIA